MSDALPALLQRNAQRAPAQVALRRKRRGIWHETTWAELAKSPDPLFAEPAGSAAAAPGLLQIGPGDELFALSSASAAARFALVSAAAAAPAIVNVAESAATELADLREIGPHKLFAPASFWNELHALAQARMARAAPLNQFLYRKLIGGGLLSGPLLHAPLKDRLGLSRIRLAASTDGALAPEAAQFFSALGVPVQAGSL